MLCQLGLISTETRNLVPRYDGCTNHCVSCTGNERGSQKTVRVSLLEIEMTRKPNFGLTSFIKMLVDK
jgi:hypothetical protein